MELISKQDLTPERRAELRSESVEGSGGDAIHRSNVIWRVVTHQKTGQLYVVLTGNEHLGRPSHLRYLRRDASFGKRHYWVSAGKFIGAYRDYGVLVATRLESDATYRSRKRDDAFMKGCMSLVFVIVLVAMLVGLYQCTLGRG